MRFFNPAPHEKNRLLRWFSSKLNFVLGGDCTLNVSWHFSMRPREDFVIWTEASAWGICSEGLLVTRFIFCPICPHIVALMVNIWPRKSSWGLWDVLRPHYEDFAKSVSSASCGRGHHYWVLGLMAEDFHLSSCPTLQITFNVNVIDFPGRQSRHVRSTSY